MQQNVNDPFAEGTTDFEAAKAVAVAYRPTQATTASQRYRVVPEAAPRLVPYEV